MAGESRSHALISTRRLGLARSVLAAFGLTCTCLAAREGASRRDLMGVAATGAATLPVGDATGPAARPPAAHPTLGSSVAE